MWHIVLWHNMIRGTASPVCHAIHLHGCGSMPMPMWYNSIQVCPYPISPHVLCCIGIGIGLGRCPVYPWWVMPCRVIGFVNTGSLHHDSRGNNRWADR